MVRQILMKKILFIILCFSWTGFIFFNSSQNGNVSHVRSMKFAAEIFNGLAHYLNLNVSKFDILTRKCAHGFEFMILAVILIIFLNIFNCNKRNIIFYTLILVLVIATLDETFQLFIPGRTSKITDVLIDFLGGIAGCFIASGIYKK